MSMYGTMCGITALAATMACADIAAAAEVRDPKTGLAVDPPAGFTARIGTPIMGDTAEIVVERQNPETSCSVSFEGSRANLAFTQQQLNELAQKPEWFDMIRTAMSAGHEVL